MFDNILVVCVGNICRSPTAEFLFKQQLPNKRIASAGLQACLNADGSGWDMDDTARKIAQANGLDCPRHEAQKLNQALVSEYDLILVMEAKHRNQIAERYPEALAKTMLLGQWIENTNNKDIPDPYKKSEDVFQHVYQLIEAATAAWCAKLK